MNAHKASSSELTAIVVIEIVLAYHDISTVRAVSKAWLVDEPPQVNSRCIKISHVLDEAIRANLNGGNCIRGWFYKDKSFYDCIGFKGAVWDRDWLSLVSDVDEVLRLELITVLDEWVVPLVVKFHWFDQSLAAILEFYHIPIELSV